MRSEAGMTLPELLVSMTLLSVVAVVFLSVLTSMQGSVARNAEWTLNNDHARLAVESIDRHMRSGNVLYAPASDGSSIVIWTQSNSNDPALDPTGVGRCIQWRVQDRELQTRWWKPQPTASQDPTVWRNVAEGIVNYVVSPTVPAFAIDPDPYKGNRMVDVMLLVNGEYEERANQTVRIQMGVTGRNTSYGYLTGRCSPIPPDSPPPPEEEDD
jgi:prepilin-type N-terminal cleavage/methylation domain-containing protein